MNKQERVKMVKAMEYIARQINDEDVFEGWLVSGVEDGDIDYGDLMNTFLLCMKRAYKSGGLYCDCVASKAE